MHLFFALSAAEVMTVTFGDTTNMYQQSPPPTEQCYLDIDDAYRSWFRKRHNDNIPSGHVIPAQRALQGHPQAGQLWEQMITGILSDLGFKSTTHEKNLYHGKLNGDCISC